MHRRGICLYLALLILVVGVAFGVRVDVDDLPRHTEIRWPRIAVEGLRWPGSADLPAFVAARAAPAAGGAVVQLGGTVDRLRLEEVRVDLTGGFALHAERGELGLAELVVEGRVQVRDASGLLLEAGRAELGGGRVRFPGLAVFVKATRRRSEIDLSLGIGALRRRLERAR